MPGNCKLYVSFPFFFDGAKTARIQLEPFASIRCYGLIVKVVLELTCGSGNNAYNIERVAYEEAITQENIQDGFMSAPFIETMEAFYFCKADKEVLVPVCAMLLKRYFPDVLYMFNINLDEYVIDIEYRTEEIGFKKSGESNVSYHNTNKEFYKKSPNVESQLLEGIDKEKTTLSCKEIIQSLKKANSKGRSFR